MRAVLLIAAKDVRHELSAGGTVGAMSVFGLLVLVVFSYLLPSIPEVRAPVLWSATVLGALLGFGNLFAAETEDGAASALLLAPVDPALVYLGKLLGAIVLLAVLEAALVPAFLVLYNVPPDGRVLRLVVVLALGTLGVAGVGTILSAMSSHTRSGGFLIPILALPVLVPLVIGASRATGPLLDGQTLGAVAEPLAVLAIFDLVFVGASALLYQPILSRE